MNHLSNRSLIMQLVCAVLLAAMCLPSAFAQENESSSDTEAADVKATPEGTEEEPESEEAQRRFRRGPNMAKLAVDGQEIIVTAGTLDTENPDYVAINNVETGKILVLTQSMATKLKTPFDLRFGDALIKKENVAPNYPGVYSLWLRKTEDGWRMVFNEKSDVWGTQHDPDTDVAEVDITYSQLDEPTDGLKLAVDEKDGGGELVISWGEHQWRAPFAIVE